MPLPRLTATLILICAGASLSTRSIFFSQVTNLNDADIASHFAPMFYQALGDKPRSDYITNFDFDGDWRGDNNWQNLANTDFPLKAHIYYSVSETSTHYFIHYAVFHPRDYKGGERKGTILSELIREGQKAGGKYDPTGLGDEAALAHENDMEGALVVAKKNGNHLDDAEVVFVETLAHNKFNRYQPGDAQAGSSKLTLEGQHPLLYIEPKGHGIEAFVGDPKQTAKKEFLLYTIGEHAEDPARKDAVCRELETTRCERSVSYTLILLSTLWAKAKGDANETYGVTFDYGEVKLATSLSGSAVSEKTFKIGKTGCAFLGSIGGVNMARPPWGWFDRDERDQPLGSWFFDPASTVKRHFKLDNNFSTTYVRLPFWASNF
jgi:hypothetical protein